MKYAFPVGTVPKEGEKNKPLPQNAIFIEMVAERRAAQTPFAGIDPIDVQGKTRLQMHDGEVTFSGEGGVPPDRERSAISVANAAMVMTLGIFPTIRSIEISGDLSGGIPAHCRRLPRTSAGSPSDKLPLDISSAHRKHRSIGVDHVVDAAGGNRASDFALNGVSAGLRQRGTDRRVHDQQRAVVVPGDAGGVQGWGAGLDQAVFSQPHRSRDSSRAVPRRQ